MPSPSSDDVRILIDRNALPPASRPQPPVMPKVPKLLSKNKPENFISKVVSIGPYHYRKRYLDRNVMQQKLNSMNYFEKKSDDSLANHRKTIAQILKGKKIEHWYDAEDENIKECNLNHEQFVEMMLMDTCFILHFMDHIFNTHDDDIVNFDVSPHLHGFIYRDLFLLENQIPFAILTRLMGKDRMDKLKHYIKDNVGDHYKADFDGTNDQEEDRKVPLHLLDLLRLALVGDSKIDSDSHKLSDSIYRSVVELKTTGIMTKPSKTRCVRDIQFKAGRFVHGTLYLPKITMDDLFESRYVNLIALEMCMGKESEYAITSFVCFLDELIDDPEDIKELRHTNVVKNVLGSDKEVADLFNTIARDLMPYHGPTYHRVMLEMEKHYRNKCKVSCLELINNHFSTPWTVISFLAGVLLLALTILQTVFTIKD